MLPTEVDWILDLLGFQWPNVDEDKMREAAEAWSSFAATVRQYQAEGTTAANAVHGANSGEAIEAFDNTWKKFAGDGYLDDAADAAEVLAIVLQVVATIVMVMKIAVIAQLIALAIELAMAQAAAPVTLGASEAGAVAATATTRVIVRRIITEAKQKIIQAITEAIQKKVVRSAKEMALELLKSVGTDAAKGIGQNLVSQGIQNHFGAKDGVSVSEAVKAGAKPLVEFEEDGWGIKGAGDKVKDIGKVGTGAYHMAQGVGQVAQGDFAEGGKKIWEGQQEQAAGLVEVAGIATKDKTPASEGSGTGEGGTSGGESGSSSSSSESGSGSTSSSEGGSGSTSSSGSGSDGAASAATPASGTTSRSATPTPPPAPTTESGQAEADRARDAFG
ncbi:hypothetical protein FCH28_26385 [Streptomyces piniterrae]|uniref:Outer membrane channel protein CpnT-like N-terminal domain-containing protein n=1 Tax=Streptomyces piniterrae TaxID=2571125 RepID=A0A4U0MXZ4_9ACTN|nr:hypothetical protein [Streptomyces piniterrae]TJZ46059.1 hypothetical protein FCH28_26385 [Streptomyces piniterrae]